MRPRAALLAAATMGYPLITLGLLKAYGVRALAIPLALLAVLRWVTARDAGACALLLALAAATAISGYTLPAKLYPVAVNLTLLGTFAGSLRKPVNFVERIARLREPDLPPQGVVYTRRVTQAWCVFFAVNGTIAAGLALYGSEDLWALYTGGIAYVLAGALFAGEYLLRQRVRRLWLDV